MRLFLPSRHWLTSWVLSSGKSALILRLLLRRLAFGLPTALQIRPGRALLFYGGGAVQFSQLEEGPAYNALLPKPEDGPRGRIWALVDCDGEPADVFRTGPFFVVQALSPCSSHRGWITKVQAEAFYMKPWSFTEVLQA